MPMLFDGKLRSSDGTMILFIKGPIEVREDGMLGFSMRIVHTSQIGQWPELEVQGNEVVWPEEDNDERNS